MRQVNLSGARLDGASLSEAYLTSSLMRRTKLQAASLPSAR
jgi:uncharacterized protein YjbI with pentapeptide repeats